MEKILSEIKELLISGRFGQALEKIRSLKLSEIPRPELLTIANIARKVGHPEVTIRILSPLIHPKNLKELNVTPAEKAVYAGALIKIGALEEAFNMLNNLPCEEAPDAYLFQAHGYMAQWNYQKAIVPLKNYIQTKGLSEDQTILGNLNLAACLISEKQFQDAEPILKELREVTENNGMKVIYGNTLELSAQWAIYQKRWAEGDVFLKQAEKVFPESNVLYAYFVRKWKGISLLSRANDRTGREGEIKDLRDQAVKLKHWESVRDCDFWKAILFHDNKLLTHVYYGTPYETFRKRIFIEYGNFIEIPDEYYWNTDLELKKTKNTIHIFEGEEKDSDFIKRKSLNYRLTMILTSDFYRPFKVGVVHAKLYPKEFFNPDSSPAKVYQAVKTLRRCFEVNKVPIKVIDSDDGYQLSIHKDYQLKIPKYFQTKKQELYEIDLLKTKITLTYFTAIDIMKVLKVSRSSANRIIKKAVESKLLEKEGFGNATRYNFKTKSAA